MARTKKQEAVDSAVMSIIGGGQARPKGGKVSPLGVLLEADEIAELDQAAGELGVSRHALLQYAARQFLADWRRGKRPELATKATKILRVK